MRFKSEPLKSILYILIFNAFEDRKLLIEIILNIINILYCIC